MALQLSRCVAAVLDRIRVAPSLFCFLDYDGTLAPIASTPAEAWPPAGTTALLARLAGAARTQVALVTGRTIDDVRRFVDVAGIYYLGVHGLEMQRPGGVLEVSPSALAIAPLIPHIRRQLEDTIGGRPGILLEEKRAAIACHYRLAARDDARAARDAAVALVNTYRQRGIALAFIDGHEVTEIRADDANKGQAVGALLAATSPAPLALYIGDDRTDEDAFGQLPPESITIRVAAAAEETLARYRVNDPQEVRVFLDDVVGVRS